MGFCYKILPTQVINVVRILKITICPVSCIVAIGVNPKNAMDSQLSSVKCEYSAHQRVGEQITLPSAPFANIGPTEVRPFNVRR